MREFTYKHGINLKHNAGVASAHKIPKSHWDDRSYTVREMISDHVQCIYSCRWADLL